MIQPIYIESGISLYHAKVEDWARSYAGPQFHALLCDPPYHLTEMTNRYGKPGAKPAGYGKDGAFQRASKGFMGSVWDGGDVAFRPDTWTALASHLLPGAFGMAFASARGWHRLAMAIEGLTGVPVAHLSSMADMLTLAIDTKNWLLVAAVEEQLRSYTALTESIQAAGLIIHPMIGWLYGSGLNKATRIDTQIDRRAKAERQVTNVRKHAPKFNVNKHDPHQKNTGYNSRDRLSFEETAPATEMAADWAGHRYSIQALKPALEPIVVFQKPYGGSPVVVMMATGAGALNIQGGRIAMAHGDEKPGFRKKGLGENNTNGIYSTGWKRQNPDQSVGRWPANVVLTHSLECSDEGCLPDCPVLMIAHQSGILTSGSLNGTYDRASKRGVFSGLKPGFRHRESDSGTAARFFEQSDWAYEVEEAIYAADPVRYQAKPGGTEKSAGLHGYEPQTVDDGRKTPIDNPYLRGQTERTNLHPTLKPVALAKYLATLLLPPARYAPRRLLVPFSGSGSEIAGGILAGWEEITGIEMTDSYIGIAQDRIRYYLGLYQQQALFVPAEIEQENIVPIIDPPSQLSLLEGD